MLMDVGSIIWLFLIFLPVVLVIARFLPLSRKGKIVSGCVIYFIFILLAILGFVAYLFI